MAKKTQKTHKGTAKVCNVRPGGTVKIGHPGTRHNTGKRMLHQIDVVEVHHY